MAATVTLSTTTLALPVTARDGRLKLASTSGVVPGVFLWLDGELTRVLVVDAQNWVTVQRGQGGSQSLPHVSSVTVYIGNGDQFYSTDPAGRPPDQIPVSPYINTVNGSVWFAQGDNFPGGQADRWYQKQETTYGVGSLGVRTKTPDPTSSA